MATSEEMVLRITEAAISSFTPTPRSGLDVEHSPFSTEPLAGYGDWLADIDPGRAWLSMLRPGASGQGLFVAFHNMFLCCDTPSGRHATHDDDGVPLLFPAVVDWASVTMPTTNRLSPQVNAEWGHDIDFPPVGIVSDWWLDDGVLFPTSNLILHEDAMFDDRNLLVPELAKDFTGMAAPWQILPITEEAEQKIRAHMADMSYRVNAHVLGHTNCEIGSGYGSDDEYWLPDHQWMNEERDPEDKLECEYYLGEPVCLCGQKPTAEQLFLALIDPLVAGVRTTAELFVPELYQPAWRLAQLNFAIGWLSVAARDSRGDAWSTWCWQRLSPFWDSDSLAELIRRLSTSSTSSATPPEFSAESSPQLTLFGS